MLLKEALCVPRLDLISHMMRGPVAQAPAPTELQFCAAAAPPCRQEQCAAGVPLWGARLAGGLLPAGK